MIFTTVIDSTLQILDRHRVGADALEQRRALPWGRVLGPGARGAWRRLGEKPLDGRCDRRGLVRARASCFISQSLLAGVMFLGLAQARHRMADGDFGTADRRGSNGSTKAWPSRRLGVAVTAAALALIPGPWTVWLAEAARTG